ncbi:MAG: hypothetical protein ABIQ73_22215 [Acidimicrobiales bacterium]
MKPRRPLDLTPVFDDPDDFARLVRTNGPFPSLQQRVMQSAVESAAITSEWITDEMIAETRAGGTKSVAVSASYRSFWARLGKPLRDDAAWLLDYDRFFAAARRLYSDDGIVVRPDEIYVNVQVPQRTRFGSAHVDIPKFRGMERREFPVWLLTTMRRSELFEHWRVPVATAVCWFYDGPGGTYTYWPEGPHAAPSQTVHPFSNTAVVGENDTMFHRGDGFASTGEQAPDGLTLDCVCEPVGDDARTWQIREGDRVLATYDAARVRIALSWSAEVYVDEAARRVADQHSDDLDLDTVVDTFVVDLQARGQAVERPDDPLHDIDFVARLARTYRVMPTDYPTVEETEAVARVEAAIGAEI